MIIITVAIIAIVIFKLVTWWTAWLTINHK